VKMSGNHYTGKLTERSRPPTTSLRIRNNFLFAHYPLLDVRFGRELNIGVLARASTDQPPQTHISEESMPDIRKETDGLGVVEVPANKPCVLRYNVRSS
jgi:hypothetical protein